MHIFKEIKMGLKSQCIKNKYEIKINWNFQGGKGGVKYKNFPWEEEGGVEFSATKQYFANQEIALN